MNTRTSFHFPYYDLPISLITEILVRLPVSNLNAFRAVCTSWRAHIESRYFITKHRNVYNRKHSENCHTVIEKVLSPSQFILHRITKGNTLTTLAVFSPFPTQDLIPNIFGACNGLFLIRQNDICMWNPFLAKSLRLPPCPIVSGGDQFVKFVFGFSTTFDDYKVLAYRLTKDVNKDAYEPAAAIYSLRNNIWYNKINPKNIDAWTSLRHPFPPQRYVNCGCTVYWVDKLHFEIIYSFNFDTEEFNYLEVPETLKEDQILVLFTIGEWLAVISSSCIMVYENHDRWREWSTESWIENFFEILEEQISRENIYPKVFFLERCNIFLLVGFLDGLEVYEVTKQKLGRIRYTNSRFQVWDSYVETLELIKGTEDMVFTRFPTGQEFRD